MNDPRHPPDHIDLSTGLPVREPMTEGRPERIEQARRFALDAAKVMADDKCEDVVVLELIGRSEVTDFLVVGSGTSKRQMRTAAEDVAEAGGGEGFGVYRSNLSEKETDWLVMDFVDVVVHVFMPETRRHYDLEMLWGDAPRLAWMNRSVGSEESSPGEAPGGRNRAGLRPDDVLDRRRPGAG